MLNAQDQRDEMHYALPQRKTAHPAPYEVKPRRSLRQNRTLRAVVAVLGALAFLLLIYRLFPWPSSTEKVLSKAPHGYPNVVVVTTIDPALEKVDPQFIESIKANRIEYAAKHGYKTFFPYTEHYRHKLEASPSSWAKVPAVRHAMANNTNTPYFFYIDHKTLIMNMDLSIEDHVMDKKRLEANSLIDVPVIPPDSIIKTFSGVPGDKVNMVISQDKDGLMPNAFVMRQGEWSKFMLDVWFDPMYQRYNFQKAERHALEHIIQYVPFYDF